jgi:hypothetical protein
MNCKKISAQTILFFFSILILQSCSDEITSPSNNYISGQILNSAGNPIPGLKVKTGDKSSVTNKAGVYVIQNVSLPYDLLIIDDSSKSQELIKSVNVPIIKIPDFFSLYYPDFKTFINVHIPPALIPPGKKGKLIFTDGAGINSTTDIQSENTRLEVKLSENTIYKGNLIVLIYSVDQTGNILSYDNFADTNDIQISYLQEPSFDFDAEDLSFNPAERNISGSIEIPAGYNSSLQYFYLNFGSTNPTFNIPDCKYSDINGNDFNIVVPADLPSDFSVLINNYISDVPNLKYSLETIKIPDNTNTVNLQAKLPADLISPQNDATEINANSVISHSAGDGSGVFVTRFFGNGYIYSVLSSEESFMFSEINKFETGDISNQYFFWTVQKYGEVADINAYLTSYPLKSDMYLSKAEQWMFKTAP